MVLVGVAMTVVALQACSSSSSNFGTPDVSVGPSSDLERSIREFVETRAMADFADSDLRVPLPEYLSTRCASSRDELAPVFQLVRVSDVTTMVDGPRARASYQIEVAIPSDPGATTPAGIAPDGPPIAVRDEGWVLEAGVWRWDGC